MKLISCYIENFGGLSQYALEFSEGVTVIQAPNGFGKTTLAEFLRAMLYGFPRKARTLDKSRRQKYTPWNGGKFGGNLVFEHEGVRFRLERTFGATPRGDSFTLIDLTTNRKSSRFSEDIGVELFQLDADSFERSTYMPQLQEGSSLTTAGIQAKLGDLVEDVNDINNFDKAMATLKAKRSGFIPYRGSGGSVAEATARISDLQSRLDRTEAKKETLDNCALEIGQMEAQLQQKHEQLDVVRDRITRASEAAARASLRKQYEDLAAKHNAAQAALAALNEKYPVGLPTAQQIEEARQLADRMAALTAQTVTTRADLDAAAYLEANARRFEGHIPQPEELDAVRGKCEAHAALLTRAENAGLAEGEQKQYASLHGIFGSGGLEDDKLDALAARNRQLLTYRAALESLTVAEEDRLQMGRLNACFAGGVPTEEELRLQQQNLDACDALRRENAQLAVSQAAIPPARKAASAPAVLGALLGIGGVALGAVLLIQSSFLFGGIALGIGILALAAAAVLHGKRRAVWEENRKNDALRSELLAQMDANEQKITACQQAVREFVRSFGGEGPIPEELGRISRDREMFLALREKLRVLKEKRSVLEEAIRQSEGALRRELEPYFSDLSDYDKAISNLRVARGRYLDLREKKQSGEQERAALYEEAAKLEEALRAFFGGYFDTVTPQRFGALVSELQIDADNYLRAVEQTAQWQERKAAHEQALGQCEGEISTFFARFGLPRPENIRSRLQQLRDDEKAWQDALVQKEALSRELARFREENAAALAAEDTERQENADSLKQAERQLSGEITVLTRSLLEKRQEQQSLRARIDEIPEIRDELEHWQEKKSADQKNAQTLDETMDFLQKAKDSLTTSYLGPIRERFGSYLERLMGEGGTQAFISPDLQVQLERLGQARELGYFSAGQTDAVMLSMRFALVDALFADAKPFVILDDPFVNLDDDRTAGALDLLKELGRNRQIIYLTCSSSRSIPNA